MKEHEIFGAHTSKVAQLVERTLVIEFTNSELKLLDWVKQKPNNKDLLKVYLDYSELLRTFAMYYKHNGILKDKLEQAHSEIRVLKAQIQNVRKEKEELFNKLGDKL